MYFDKKVIFFNLDVKDREEALAKISEHMLKEQLVSSNFLENVLERERVYPTGLSVNGIGIAIPHTDSEYVKKSQLGFALLKQPIVFHEMGTLDKEVDVKLIFMLALKEAHEQLNMLQHLIEMFQNESVISKLLTVESQKDFLEIMATQNLE